MISLLNTTCTQDLKILIQIEKKKLERSLQTAGLDFCWGINESGGVGTFLSQSVNTTYVVQRGAKTRSLPSTGYSGQHLPLLILYSGVNVLGSKV